MLCSQTWFLHIGHDTVNMNSVLMVCFTHYVNLLNQKKNFGILISAFILINFMINNDDDKFYQISHKKQS